LYSGVPRARAPVNAIFFRYNIVIKKAGAKLFELGSDRPLPGYVNGDTTVFEVLHQPRTYNAYRFE